VQSFVAEHPFNLIQPLLLRSLTFTPRDNATVFETAPGTCTSGEGRLLWGGFKETSRRFGGDFEEEETLGEKFGTFDLFIFSEFLAGCLFFFF
jgi:hypothetical protein